MGRRKLTVQADPAACAAGLAALEALARAGRTDLAESIAALAAIVAKPAPRETRGPFVKVHMARDWERVHLFVSTYCGVHGSHPLHLRGDPDLTKCVDEVDTAECNIIEVTADRDLVTCVRCLRLSAPRSA